jgi:hypothetical protein
VVRRKRLEHGRLKTQGKSRCHVTSCNFGSADAVDKCPLTLCLLVADDGGCRKVFIDLLLDLAGKRLDEQQLRDETTTMISAVRQIAKCCVFCHPRYVNRVASFLPRSPGVTIRHWHMLVLWCLASFVAVEHNLLAVSNNTFCFATIDKVFIK